MLSCCSPRTRSLVVASTLMVFGAVNFLALLTDLSLDDQPLTFKTAIGVCDSVYFLVGSLVVHGVTSNHARTVKLAVLLLLLAYFAAALIYAYFFLAVKNFGGLLFIPLVLVVYLYIALALWSHANQLAQ